MPEEKRSYIAIDLKSFYASVECAALGLDPLTTNLVVADLSRTEKTICLAVSPSLKAYGISGRARLFEVVQRVKQVNSERLKNAPDHRFTGKSSNAADLDSDSSLELDYIAAKPQMARYMRISTEIFGIYMKYIAPEDIHVYSIDEVFIDATSYLRTYKMTPRELAMTMIKDVLEQTGITATAGIGTNLYLAKVAMDIVAKHIPADKDGVRIAEIDESGYRRQLWGHTPITDFWRVGKGIAARLENLGLYTMGDIAYASVKEEETLYRTFGINAELLIDHAWGWEPCRISDIKSYKPENSSISSGQVLKCPYTFDKARLVLREMIDSLSLDLVDKRMTADQIWINIIYDTENLGKSYKGEITDDRYGRRMPKPAHGSVNLPHFTSSSRLMTEAADRLFCEKVNRSLTVRRIYVTANHVIPESEAEILENREEDDSAEPFRQLDLFSEPAPEKCEKKITKEDIMLGKEKSVQKAMLGIKKKYGKNSVVKAMDLEDGATAIERNGLVGGHKA